jgi:hypothetical protein
VPTFAERGVPRGQRDGSLRPYSWFSRPKSLLFLSSSSSVVYSRGWVDPVPDPLLLRKSDRTGNRTRTSGSVTRNSDHYTTLGTIVCKTERYRANLSMVHIDPIYHLLQWYSTWGTRTTGGMRRHLSWCPKTSYINQNERQEPLEPWTSSDPSTHENSSPNWGAGMPETISVISLKGQDHINNRQNTFVPLLILWYYYLRHYFGCNLFNFRCRL